MKRKYKQVWSNIPPLLIQQTITSLLKLLNTTKTTGYGDDHGLDSYKQCVRGQTDLRKCDSYDIGQTKFV